MSMAQLLFSLMLRRPRCNVTRVGWTAWGCSLDLQGLTVWGKLSHRGLHL